MMTFPASGLARPALRPMVQFSRALPSWMILAGHRRGRPLALFLPAAGRDDGAARLRMYNIAEGLRHHGWTGMGVPPTLTLAQRCRFIGAARPDVVVMQGARHMLNRPALYSGERIVLDMDDADFHLSHLERPVREAMPQVAAVIAGSTYVADWCRGARAARADVVITGAPVSTRPRPPQAGRPPVVVWAQTRPMTYTREAAFVREVMARVAAVRGDARLRLCDARKGDDLAFLQSFRDAGVATEWVPRASYDRYLAGFDDAAVGLAPLCPETPFSRGKSVGKVLAYLDRKVPVVASAAGEHGRVFTAGTGVVSDDPDVWVAEILRLLDDASARQAMADAAFARFETKFCLPVTAARVANILGEVAGVRSPAQPAPAETPVGA